MKNSHAATKQRERKFASAKPGFVAAAAGACFYNMRKIGNNYCTTKTSSNCPPPTCGPLITSGLRLLNFVSVSSKRSFSL